MAVETITPPAPYDMPEALRPALRDGAQYPGNRLVKGYRTTLSIHENVGENPYDVFSKIRTRLCEDASRFYNDVQLPVRPDIPRIETGVPLKRTLKDLYMKTSGLVIGETHAGLGSKQFLIDNMSLLAKQKIKTLYMEQLLTDFHQADLDTFASTAEMPEQLKEYLTLLDEGHRTDPSGRYTFMNVIKAAAENHIRVRAIDCMASYRLSGMSDQSGTLRQQVMNYFAKIVIDTDQAKQGSHKWVALVGNSHANTYQGVPGVAELEGAIGLRVEDATALEVYRIEPDPGREMTTNMGRPAGLVKSDLRLKAPVRSMLSDTTEDILTQTGMFGMSRPE